MKITTRDLGMDSPAPKYLKMGINNNVVIGKLEGVEPESGSPYIDINFHLDGATEAEGKKVRFYLSEKAEEHSLKKIVHIATKVVSREIVDNIVSDDLKDYATKLGKLITGKKIDELLFSGRERNTGTKTVTDLSFPLPPFARQKNSSDTPLVFDPNNQYHWEKLPVPDAEKISSNGALNHTEEFPFND